MATALRPLGTCPPANVIRHDVSGNMGSPCRKEPSLGFRTRACALSGSAGRRGVPDSRQNEFWRSSEQPAGAASVTKATSAPKRPRRGQQESRRTTNWTGSTIENLLVGLECKPRRKRGDVHRQGWISLTV